MEKKNNGYKYKFSKWFYIVAAVGFLIAVGCIILNALRFANNMEKDIEIGVYEYMSLGFSIILSIAFIIIVTLALIKSQYFIEKDKIVLRWGIIKNTIKISDVKSIRLVTTTEKLELVFEDESFFVIVTDKSLYQRFVDELKSLHPEIEYNQTSEE